jgi:hypothetical protein
MKEKVKHLSNPGKEWLSYIMKFSWGGGGGKVAHLLN